MWSNLLIYVKFCFRHEGSEKYTHCHFQFAYQNEIIKPSKSNYCQHNPNKKKFNLMLQIYNSPFHQHQPQIDKGMIYSLHHLFHVEKHFSEIGNCRDVFEIFANIMPAPDLHPVDLTNFHHPNRCQQIHSSG